MNWTEEAIAALVLAFTQFVKLFLPDTAWRNKAVPILALVLGITMAVSDAVIYGHDPYVALWTGVKGAFIAVGAWSVAANTTGYSLSGTVNRLLGREG
jgi:hypothetical protein